MIKREYVLLLLTIILIGSAALLQGEFSSSSDDSMTFEQIRHEIVVLNLVNGLDLTTDQMEMILSYAEKSDELRRRFQSVLFRNQSQMEKVLSEIKTYLRKNEEIPPLTKQEYHRLANEIKKARLEMDEGMKRLAQDVRQVLKAHQIYQLQQFKPCIIPPKGDLRIGQVDNHQGLTRQIERIRRLPPRIYERRKAWIVSRTLKGMKLHLPRGIEIDEEAIKDRIEKIFDEARSLEETEFEVQKEELAKRLLAPLKRPEDKNSLLRKIEVFLLSAEAIPLLEERTVRGQGN